VAKVVGISGSPVKDSNTDRLIKLVLENTELNYEFIKLSNYDLHPCQACLGCAGDNICKQNDDWNKVASKIKEGDALVIGGYAPYDVIDAYTKIFMERMYSLRHRHLLNKNKPAIAIAMASKESRSSNIAVNQIANFIKSEKMKLIGTITAEGNTTCLSCGYGEDCKISNVHRLYGKSAKINSSMFTCIEEQEKVIDQTLILANKLKDTLNKGHNR